MTLDFAPDRDEPAIDHVFILDSLFTHLLRFADPFSPNGFLQVFSDWVFEEWSTRPYYRVQRFHSEFELAHFPIRTDYLLKEMQPVYRDFIHSYNGRHHFSPVAVNGTNCETMEKELYDFFHESMRAEGLDFMESRFPHLDVEDFWDRIFLEEFHQAEEIHLVDRLCQFFGFYGQALDPYLCEPPETETLNPGLFADWYLDDFREATQSSFTLSRVENV
ncbi:MAG: hypothetical protein EOP04_01265 [Proteobacteria bacterium]|nr:MAG: hypothetical protein EOP04_01265 [Pseudomonadota bacterium]